MNFGDALIMLKRGACMNRANWNGKNQFIYLHKLEEREVPRDSPLHNILPMGAPYGVRPYLMMKLGDGTTVPWLASQSDILEDDWVIVHAPKEID